MEAEISKKARSATKSLRKAVDTVLQRYERLCEKRNLPELTDHCRQSICLTLDHIKLWLTRLLLKTTALSVAMETFMECWSNVKDALEQELQNNNKDELLARVCRVLEHLFLQLIRLHDALILCISGECRHEGDIRAAKQAKYPSQLNKQNHSRDGASTLYSSNLHYSGESWDEFHDDTNGIKQRLLHQLVKYVSKSQRDELWDLLLEKGALAFESVIDEIQNSKETVQSHFTSFKERAPLELTLLFQKYGSNVKVELRLPDKLEKLFVRMNSLEWKLQRYGDKFQVNDTTGVLPLLYSKEEWKRVLLLPTSSRQPAPKKTRKVIIDSSESENDESMPTSLRESTNKKAALDEKIATASGLVVSCQQRSSTQQDTRSNEPISVSEIKQQFGVDSEQLAESRQVMEDEEAATKQAALKVDQAPEEGTDLPVETCLLQVKRLRKILIAAILRVKGDDFIWNARECLRETCMTAGNRCLEASIEEDSPVDMLEKAISCFDEAQSLVKKQQNLLRSMSTTSQDPFFSNPGVKHRYMLLLGRSQVNSAIARIDLVSHIPKHDGKQLEREARKQLDMALKTTQTLVQDIKNQNQGTTEAIIDMVNAYELESLAHRWKGSLLWSQCQRGSSPNVMDAVKCFECAASILKDADPTDYMYDDELFQATLEALVQGYFAWSTLADLAVKTLDDAKVESIRDQTDRYDCVCDEAVKAIEAAAGTSQSLYQLVSLSPDSIAHEAFLKDQDVLLSKDLLESVKEIREYWKKKREVSLRSIEPSAQHGIVGRSDLHIADEAPALPFAGRFVVYGSSASQGRKQRQLGTGNHRRAGGSNDHDDDNNNASSLLNNNNPPPTRKYRRWGDELLPQTTDERGRSIPKLVYPAVAPELPAELKAKWEENLRRQREGETVVE